MTTAALRIGHRGGGDARAGGQASAGARRATCSSFARGIVWDGAQAGVDVAPASADDRAGACGGGGGRERDGQVNKIPS